MFPATRNLLNPTRGGVTDARLKKFAEPIAILMWNLLHREASYLNMRPRCQGGAAGGSACVARDHQTDPWVRHMCRTSWPARGNSGWRAGDACGEVFHSR